MRRLLNKIEKDISTGCWNWKAAKAKSGYGTFSYNGKKERAHRVSWMLFKNETINDKCVLHRCDNRLCVNPEHLFIGTAADNIKDMINKGRQKIVHPGEKNPASRLKQKDIIEIKNLKSHGYQTKEICSLFKISDSQVYRIVKGQQWRGR